MIALFQLVTIISETFTVSFFGPHERVPILGALIK